MFCPRCGQRQQNNQARFCSGCRFVMTGMDRVIYEGGLSDQPVDTNVVSPKILGLKQGGLMFLSGIVVVPLLAMLTEFIGGSEFVVALAALTLFVGGIARMIYALIFQPHRLTKREDAGFVESVRQIFLGEKKTAPSLPEAEPVPAEFVPSSVNWRDTADLQYSEKRKTSTF